jgi:hypothetical protein
MDSRQRSLLGPWLHRRLFKGRGAVGVPWRAERHAEMDVSSWLRGCVGNYVVACQHAWLHPSGPERSSSRLEGDLTKASQLTEQGLFGHGAAL